MANESKGTEGEDKDPSAEFTAQIHHAIDKGKGIVPLFGAGLSAAAGIPTRAELILYLKLCVAKALGLGSDLDEYWHPQLHPWPQMEGEWARWAREGFKRLVDVSQFRLERWGGKTSAYQALCQQALGALTDWRLALQFLSRIRLREDKDVNGKRSAEPDGASFKVNPLLELAEIFQADVRRTLDKAREMASGGALNSGLTSALQKTDDVIGLLEPGEEQHLEAFKRDITQFRDEAAKLCDELIKRGETIEHQIGGSTARPRESKDLADRITARVNAQPSIILGDIDEHIFDSFFTHIVAGKSPSMEHRMVTHFFHALRTRVILSLNFDDLIEQAFRESGKDLAVFDVHHEATLPPWSQIGAEPALIKLHGGRYGLRADFTLDREPTVDDYRNFRSYLSGKDWVDTPSKPGAAKPATRSHLLVAGVSCDDRRVRMLVLDALSTYSDLQVFWCCYTDKDETDVRRVFGSLAANNDAKNADHAIPRVIPVRHSHLGLLLWEVYQRVTRCLPPRGLEYPTTWQIPNPPRLPFSEKTRIKEKFADLLHQAREWRDSESTRPALRLTSPAYGADEARPTWGVTPLGWYLFDGWNETHKCIWLDSEDLLDLEELMERLLQAVAARTGRQSQKPAIPRPQERIQEYREELKRLLQSSGQDWVIFLNLRGSHGYNGNPFARFEGDRDQENGVQPTDKSVEAWIHRRRLKWESAWHGDENRLKIEDFLSHLARDAQQCGTKLVLLVYGEEFLPKTSGEYELFHELSDTTRGPDKAWASTRAQEALKWRKEGINEEEEERRTKLLQALVIFHRVRHHTALVSRAVLNMQGKDQWKKAWKDMDHWLEDLIKKRILRRRAGGFLWMDWELREHLRYHLLQADKGGLAPEGRATLHLGIADWHMTFFHSTGDPLAVFQAVYHRCRVAQLSLQVADQRRADAARPEVAKDEIQSQEMRREINDQLVRARGALCEANNHLEAARAGILSRGHSLDIRRCLDGYFHLLCPLVAKETRLYTEERTNPEAKKSHERNLRFLLMVKTRAEMYRLWFQRDMGDPEGVIRTCVEFEEWRNNWKQTSLELSEEGTTSGTLPEENEDMPGALKLWDFYGQSWPEEQFWNSNAVDLEHAIVYITLRSYKTAASRLKKILDSPEIAFPDIAKECKDDRAVWSKLNEWTDKCPSQGVRYSVRRFVVHVLRRQMELCLLEAELKMNLAYIDDRFAEKPWEDDLQKAQMVYLAAIMLPRYVAQEEYNRLAVELSRLHSIMAGVLAMRGDHDGVHRRINEALVSLAHLPESEETIAHVVVDLRRIFCKLAELDGIEGLKSIQQTLTQHRPRQVEGDDARRFALHVAKAEALLEDIRLLIVIVEQRMSRHRKSRWWWMTMCRYKFVWFEHVALIRHWHETDGREDATKTVDRDFHLDAEVARELFLEVCRRVNSDAYQFARITLSYLHFVRLHGQFARQDETEEASKEVKRQRGKAIDAMERARERLKKIGDAVEKKSSASGDADAWKLDPRIQTYISYVDRQLKVEVESWKKTERE